MGKETKTAYICPLQFAVVFTFVFFHTSKIYKSLLFVVVALIFLIVLLVFMHMRALPPYMYMHRVST